MAREPAGSSGGPHWQRGRGRGLCATLQGSPSGRGFEGGRGKGGPKAERWGRREISRAKCRQGRGRVGGRVVAFFLSWALPRPRSFYRAVRRLNEGPGGGPKTQCDRGNEREGLEVGEGVERRGGAGREGERETRQGGTKGVRRAESEGRGARAGVKVFSCAQHQLNRFLSEKMPKDRQRGP